MKRVLHVIDSLHLGGAQEVVLNLATCGDCSAYHHEVATMHGRGVYWDRMRALGIPVHSLSPHKLLPWYAVSLPVLLARGHFDILHCHLIASNIFAKPVGTALGVRAIINHDHTNDDYRASQRVRLTLDSLSNRFANHLIAVSDSCRQFLIQREGVPKEKISLVQNAISLDRFSRASGSRAAARQRLGLADGATVVAGVGRLNPQKNFSMFLRIAAALALDHPGLVFVLAGEGPEEALLKSLAAELGLSDRVVFAGYVADTRAVYLAADILLMPSLFEGLPMTLLEAMAMELPVVASALDGMAEVIEHGTDGFLVPRDSPEGFVETLDRLLRNPLERADVGSRASQKIAARFSASRMCAEVEAIYRRLLA